MFLFKVVLLLFFSFYQTSSFCSVVLDPEIHDCISSVTDRLCKGAKITQSASFRFFVFVNRELNAAATTDCMIIHTGTLVQITNTKQLIGIIAHEFGHLQEHHVIQSYDQIKRATKGIAIATLATLVAAIVTNNSNLATAAIAGGMNTMGNSITGAIKAREYCADSAAIGILKNSQASPDCLYEAMKILSKTMRPHTSATSMSNAPNYGITHPAVTERLEHAKSRLAESKPYKLTRFNLFEDHFNRLKMKAKICQGDYVDIIKRYKTIKPKGENLYIYSLALFANKKTQEAIRAIKEFLSNSPEDFYARHSYANFLYYIGKTEDAAKELKQTRIQAKTAESKSIWIITIDLIKCLIDLKLNDEVIKEVDNIISECIEEIYDELYDFKSQAFFNKGNNFEGYYWKAESELVLGKKPQATILLKEASKYAITNSHKERIKVLAVKIENKNTDV